MCRKTFRNRFVERRCGATVVEFAIVLPVVFLMLVAAVEFGRVCFVLHGLKEAARQAVRVAVVGGAQNSEVQASAAQVLNPAGITKYTLTVNPDPLDQAEQWAPVTVSVTTAFRDVSWLPAPPYLGSVTLSGASTLPREAERSP